MCEQRTREKGKWTVEGVGGLQEAREKFHLWFVLSWLQLGLWPPFLVRLGRKWSTSDSRKERVVSLGELHV